MNVGSNRIDADLSLLSLPRAFKLPLIELLKFLHPLGHGNDCRFSGASLTGKTGNQSRDSGIQAANGVTLTGT